MARLTLTETRHTSLRAVNRDSVRFHDGRTGPALGYTWAENAGGQMPEEMRLTLHELWAADLISVADSRMVAQRGRRVSITNRGNRYLREWAGDVAEQVAA